MTAVHKHFAIWMLLLSCAAAQNTPGTATVQNVAVTQEGADLRVEITLSSPVKPAIDTALHPDRILLDLPETVCTDQTQKKVDVHVNGVSRIRTSQHSTSPLVTRVVLDLDQAHPYNLRSEGNRIVLIVSPSMAVRRARQIPPAAATSGTLVGIFRRRQGLPPLATPDDSPAPAEPVPPPSIAAAPVSSAPASSSSVTTPPSSQAATPVSPNKSAMAAVTTPAAQASFSQNQIASSSSAQNTTRVAAPTVPPVDVAPLAPSKPPDTGKVAAIVETPPAAAVDAPAVAAAGAPTPTPEVTMIARTDDPSLRTVFKVKYVAEGVAYLDGGRSSGLTEGMKLEVQDSDRLPREGAVVDSSDAGVVAELVVTALAETSAVTDIHTPKRAVKTGDLAYLSSGDSEALVQQRALSATRKYPAVITFTEGDPLDEEVRDQLPRPPLPSVNRARGRFGFDYMGTVSHGTTSITSSDVGMIFRGDITRINGTYWNLSGYWRGRFTSQVPAGQQTLQDLINRTYHLSMIYDNPNSSLVAGFGRLYLPWAPSLNTIDGGYFGKRLSKGTTLGIFGGSTPDPTSWNYSPGRVISGAFINFDGGSFDGVHYSSTSGAGVSMVNWQIDRPFVFFENTVTYKRYLSIYDSLQADNPSGNPAVPAPGAGLSVNFLTVRVQPHPRLELDFNYNYFRDIPTFDPTLIGTGLLDKYLFQGFSVGGRVDVWKQLFVYTDIGRSNRTGDTKNSLNQMYGVTFGRIPWVGLRADAHYSQFKSSFGNGSYRAFSLSRNFLDGLRLEVLAGDQNFSSTFTSQNHSRFITGNVESNFGPHYFIQGGYTADRGQMSYDQWMFTIGYRFDSKERHR